MPPAGFDGTYPYDGGPMLPAPLPRADVGPRSTPAKADGSVVTLGLRPTKLSYPAYGEKPAGAPEKEKPILAKATSGTR
jgi:hypothetical protein